jgi:hypothetical protein
MSSISKINIDRRHQQDLISKTRKFIDFWRDFQSKNDLLAEPGDVISREDKVNFDKFVESLYKKGKDKHLSGSTIKSECITYLDDIINSKNYTDDYIGRELKSLIKRLEDKVHQRIVIFPIDN